MIPVFCEHSGPIIGQVIDIKVDNFGIKFALWVWEEVYQEKLSFGFTMLKYDTKENVRLISAINIKEVSLVFFPAQENTKCMKIRL